MYQIADTNYAINAKQFKNFVGLECTFVNVITIFNFKNYFCKFCKIIDQ